MAFLADHLTLDAPRRTREGFLAVRAKAARTGVYQYTGAEVDPTNAHGLRDKAIVNVLRDENTVFDRGAVQSFIGKPVTDDHPSQPVTKDNWRQHARGTIMGALRDGDYVAFDLLVTDAEAISKIEAGKRELSNGYGAELEFGEFKAKDGTVCDARQSKITGGNHVALVDRGRAGSDCRIADARAFATCDANPEAVARLSTEGKAMKKIVLDGLQVDLSDADAVSAAISKLQAQVADAVAAKETAETKAVADAAAVVAKDTEIADLKRQLADAAITPAKLADAAKEYADVQAKAKAAGVTVAADADTAAIKKAVVDAKMGEAAKAYTADNIAIAFDVLTKGVTVADTKVHSIGAPLVADTATLRDKARMDYINGLNGQKKDAA
ncbi:DUF2213 domain-containing protein [Sphingomonas baiyangensis]|uniref:DUF2213 domain-containing protein n=1 Tax=Sphingomonas baiyangensis TaxID=2572576 RepID=A0A4U1L1X3_9SPHN|nr:DUF2213 domain-containing protein [Sphingomonas baiyangensis]TKD50210.1 DUF2213 domain-containing protein [Sphingomonas baiyangensis]